MIKREWTQARSGLRVRSLQADVEGAALPAVAGAEGRRHTDPVAAYPAGDQGGGVGWGIPARVTSPMSGGGAQFQGRRS